MEDIDNIQNKVIILLEKELQDRVCKNCKHWGNVNKEIWDSNVCNTIRDSDELEIKIIAGLSGGIVNTISTYGGFSCVHFTRKDIHDNR